MQIALKIAFDVSILAQQFARGFGKTGIYRTIEELLQALSGRADVDLAVTGICGPNPVASSFLASHYVEHRAQQGTPFRFAQPIRSRLKMEPFYSRLYRAYAASAINAETAARAPSLPVRIASRSVSYMSWFDSAPNFRAASFDAFHSTYLGFPRRSLTRIAPRILTVYDLIPIVAPHFVQPGHARDTQKILDTLDPERDWVICISEYGKREFCQHTGMDPERVFVTPLAAADHFRPVEDPERIAEVRRRYGIPEGGYLLSTANLEPRKNFVHLIRCFFRMRAERRSEAVSLVLVGSKGWKHAEIAAAAAEYPSLADSVKLTGHLSDGDLAALYAGALGFVYPSLHEGFGLPPLEAMQCGVPVITSTATSIPEVVGHAAITVDPTDADALSHAMWNLIRDGSLRETLRNAGLERARQFSWKRCADDTVRAYRTAAAASSSPQRTGG